MHPAEIGADMTCFATARHLASWGGQCPGNDQSAGKRRSGKTRDGSKWLDFALEEAAMAAIRVKAKYRAAQYQRGGNRHFEPTRARQHELMAHDQRPSSTPWRRVDAESCPETDLWPCRLGPRPE